MNLKKMVIWFPVLSAWIAFSSCNFSGSSALAQSEYDSISKSPSVEKLEVLIKKFPDDKVSSEAVKLRDKLVFDSICTIDNYAVYTDFIQKFPQSDFVEKAKQRREQIKGIRAVISTFRGNSQRNYYGNIAPSKLDEIWTINLGSGKSFAYGKMYVWTGAGWTG